MRVFVTGSSGQIGRAVTTALLESGFDVVGAARRRWNANLSEQIQVELGRPGAVRQINSSVSPCVAIVHAAASVSDDPFNSAITLTNCVGAQQMTELAALWNVRNLVFISSIPVVGPPRPGETITEEQPAKPHTAYHASKVFGEQLVRLAHSENRAAVTLRIASPVGVGTPVDRIFGAFVTRAAAGEPLVIFGAGTRRQNYVDVRDIAAAVARSLRCNASGLYNIAGATSVSDLELAHLCVQLLGSQSAIELLCERNADDSIVWDISIAKANRDLGFHPRFTVADSIRAFVAS